MVSSAPFLQKRKFIIKLGKALHKFGTPAYRLEAHLTHVAEFLGIQANFIITPTALTFVLWQDEEHQEYNHVVRVQPGELDLGALARTDELVDELSSGQRDLTQALERLDDIANKPEPYSKWLTFLAFGASSGAFAMLMATSWNDVFWSTVLGFIICLIFFWSMRSKRVTTMLEPLSALISGILASAIATIDNQINLPFIILSSIIVFIPGLSLTLGLAELAARDLISGTARVMDAIMCLFKLYFGAVLGVTIGGLVFGTVEFIKPETIAPWTAWLAVPILSASLVIMFRSRLKEAPWGMLSGFVAFSASIWASSFLGVALSAFVGAFALGIYANLFSRFMDKPALIVTLQGLVVLVPGSKVYIGLNSAISGSYMLYDSQLGSQTFLIFMSLVAGLIFANTLVAARKTL
jgi:uncharacterized membrane protein YjjP (DUF1212 family)